jgi:hypothetical protein
MTGHKDTDLERLLKEFEREFAGYEDYSAELERVIKEMALKLTAQERQIAEYRAKLKLQRKAK